MTNHRPKKLTFSRDTLKVLNPQQLSHVYSGLLDPTPNVPIAPMVPGTALGCDDMV